MKERIMLFGKSRGLVGITSEPTGDEIAGPRAAVIFINAGLIHRIGPNRVYVKLARILAAQGHLTLRFDFSGLGDSAPRTDGVSLEERAMQEIREAMDALESQKSAERFILVGLCSGADDAIRVACQDSRVAGTVLMDASMGFSRKYKFYSYAKRMLRLRSWINLVTRKSDLFQGVKRQLFSPKQETNGQVEAAEDWPVISDDEFVHSLKTLTERDVPTLLVYTDDSPAYFNFRTRTRERLKEVFSSGTVATTIVKCSDHTFTRLCHQRELILAVCDWTEQQKERMTPPPLPDEKGR